MRAFDVSKVVSFYLAMAALAVAAIVGRGSAASLLPGKNLAAWALALGLGCGAGIGMVVVSRLAVAQFAWAAQLAREFRSIFGELRQRDALALAIMSAVGEEALFRGVLQPSLGLALGALVFGLLHIGPNARFLPWTVMACAAGFLFGWLFVLTGTLVAPALAHFLVNFLNLRYIAAHQRPWEVHLGPVGGEGAASS